MNNAIKYSNLPSSKIECGSFSVSKKVQSFPDSSSAIFLTITFQADNAVPFTLLKLYTSRLQGEYRIWFLQEYI